MRIIVIVMLISGLACQAQNSTGPTSPDVADPSAPNVPSSLVKRSYSGGNQCDSRPELEAELVRIRASLANAGITLLEEYTEPNAVCSACNCPEYSFEHILRVPDTDLETVGRLGYRRIRPAPHLSE